MMNEATSTLGSLVMVILSAVVMVVLGLIFFLVNLWIIDIAAKILKLDPEASFVVLSAALLSAASMIGSRKR
jgi:hypothetical protein